MVRQTQISIPTLVRVKEGALDRLPNFYTVLSSHDVYPEVARLLSEDRYLANCFRD